MKLTINLATRGRPELLIQTIEQTLKNIRDLNTVFMVSADCDDEATLEALAAARLPILIDDRGREDSLGAKYNRCLTVAPADVYLAMVDYAPHVTPGFDERILEAVDIFPDRIAVIYNHMANASFPGINAVTHRLADLMGEIYPEHFPYWWVDHWLDDIARMIGRIVFADVVIDTSARPGTQGKRDLPFWAEFFDRSAPMRERCALRIIESREFISPPWLKEALIRNFPLVRERSRAINMIAMREGAAGDEAPDDERHARLRAAAQDLVGSIEVQSWPAAQPVRNPQSVVIATPNYSHWVSGDFSDSKVETQAQLMMRGIPHRFIRLSGNGLVALVRNKLATAYREDYDKFDNLFLIDDDVDWQFKDLLAFITRQEPVLIGCYRKKTDPAEPPQFAVDFMIDDQGEIISNNNLLRVGSVGSAGFMRIKRWVVDKIAGEYGTFADKTTDKNFSDRYLNLFQDGPDDRREWNGEDVVFIRRCLSLGIEVWCDPTVELGHRGSYVWRGRLADNLNVVGAAE